MPAAPATSPASSSPPWRDLPPDLVGRVIAHLPFPADRAHLRSVCRAWRSAARENARHHHHELPWIVLPDGSFCTAAGAGEDDGGVFFPILPGLGLPEAATTTCLGAASAGGWLALDRTAGAHRRTSLLDKILCTGEYSLVPRGDVSHRHTYLLHNPFSGATVPLPELDAIAGYVPEAFEVRKVLMRSPDSPDDVVAVVTNCRACSVILLRPGKGASVVRPYVPVFDVAFLAGDDDKLYGITPDEDLIAFHLADDDDSNGGRPVVTKIKRVIRHPLAVGEEDLRSWMDDDTDDGEEDQNRDDDEEEEEDSGGDDDDPAKRIEDSFNAYGQVPDGSATKEYVEEGKKVPGDDEAKDLIITTPHLIESSNGGGTAGNGLLMARHQVLLSASSGSYTHDVELFRADLDSGRWVPITRGGLAGEALFLSRSFSKSTPAACGGTGEGLVYSAAVDNVFDTRSGASREFTLPLQRKLMEGDVLTWLFPLHTVVY